MFNPILHPDIPNPQIYSHCPSCTRQCPRGWDAAQTPSPQRASVPVWGDRQLERQIKHAVLDGNMCLKDPGTVGSLFSSVLTEDLAEKAACVSDAASGDGATQIPAGT